MLLLSAGAALVGALGIFAAAPLYMMQKDPKVAVLAAATDNSYPWVPKAVAMAYLKRGSYDPNTVSSPFGQTLFDLACAGYGLADFDNPTLLEIIDLLAERGANPNLRSSQGFTPLQSAILANEPILVQRLLRLGADVKQRVDRPGAKCEGCTMLELARYLQVNDPDSSRESIVRLLEGAQ